MCSYRLERGQEKVVWKQISAQIHEIIHDIHFPFLSVSIPQNGFGFGVARVHGQNQNQADDSGNQWSDQKVDNGPQSNFPIHFGIQTCRTWKKIWYKIRIQKLLKF